MSTKPKAARTAAPGTAFKSNLRLNFSLASNAYTAIYCIAVRYSLIAPIVLLFLEGMALGVLMGGTK